MAAFLFSKIGKSPLTNHAWIRQKRLVFSYRMMPWSQVDPHLRPPYKSFELECNWTRRLRLNQWMSCTYNSTKSTLRSIWRHRTNKFQQYISITCLIATKSEIIKLTFWPLLHNSGKTTCSTSAIHKEALLGCQCPLVDIKWMSDKLRKQTCVIDSK